MNEWQNHDRDRAKYYKSNKDYANNFTESI